MATEASKVISGHDRQLLARVDPNIVDVPGVTVAETTDTVVLVDTSRHSPAHCLAGAIDRQHPKVVGIMGASGSGKTTLATALANELGAERALTIDLDDYLRYSQGERRARGLTGADWGSRYHARFLRDLDALKKGKVVEKPLVNYAYDRPSGETETVLPRDVVLLHGTLDLTNLADLLIFTAASDEVVTERRLARDTPRQHFASTQLLEDHIRRSSLPAFKAKVLPVIYEADYILSTSEGVLLQRLRARHEAGSTPASPR